MAYPLEGIRVLDMSRVLAGPFAGRLLSDLGADVVKVEPPAGDVTRTWGANIGGNPGYYHQQNVGKRNVSIDLNHPDGPKLLRLLAAKADVLIENFRPGVMKRFGIDYAALRPLNPRLVMLSISGFGQDGPESQRAAYAVVIHAESGLIARQAAENGTPPVDLPLSVADTNSSLHGLVAVLSALLMRERTGRGQHIDMAMIDATLATDDGINFELENSLATKLLPTDIWETAAGPIVIAGDFRHIWNQLAGICGLEDPTPPNAPLEEKATLRREAAQQYLRDLPTRTAVIDALDRMNLAWGDVRPSSDVASQPTVVHRGTIGRIDDRAGGTRPVVRSPYRFSEAESGVRRPAPWMGEHNEEVLREWLGADDAEVARWQEVLVSAVPART